MVHNIDPSNLAVFQFWLKNGQLEDTDSLLPEATKSLTKGTNQEMLDDFLLSETLPEWLVGNIQEIVGTYLDPKFERLVDCYLLGAYLQCPGFQNATINAIVNSHMHDGYYKYWIPLYNLYYICENTTSKEPLRRLTVDMIYWCLSDDTLALAKKLKIIPGDILDAVDNVAATVPQFSPFIQAS
jgi:hypothetical protein